MRSSATCWKPVLKIRSEAEHHIHDKTDSKAEIFSNKAILNLFHPQAVKNAVGALCSLSPNQLLPRLMGHVTESLSRPALRQVTKEEYAIMLTPAGELYDDSIMQRYGW